nr:HD domain-containing protein [Spiractinospora alimapuensis]
MTVILLAADADDLVEVYAGDTPTYDIEGEGTQREREEAAEKLFGLLPEDQATRLRTLWDEFEARFAKAMDRFQPLLLNWMTHGGTRRSPGVTADAIRARKAVIGDASTPLGHAARRPSTRARHGAGPVWEARRGIRSRMFQRCVNWARPASNLSNSPPGCPVRIVSRAEARSPAGTSSRSGPSCP